MKLGVFCSDFMKVKVIGKLVLPGLFVLLSIASSHAQKPFICQGQSFITWKQGSYNSLSIVDYDPSSGNVTFNSMGSLNVIINSIGYRSTDNLIYGFDPNSSYLYRVDANANAVRLKTLNLNGSLKYLGGDVTPDGNYLVLIGGDPASNPSGIDKEMVFIDLTDPNYPITNTIDISGNGTRIYDFAYDPISGNIYAYDIRNSSLVIMNNNGSVLSSLSSAPTTADMGSLFFDVYGNLRGYGTNNPGVDPIDDLFDIDKTTGAVTKIGSGPVATSTDGCSCPYNIDLLLQITPDTLKTCNSVVFEFAITNSSNSSKSGITIDQQLPVGFNITSITNPFGGTVTSGINTNHLRIENMSIPKGTDLIRMTVYIDKVFGNFSFQSRLSGLPASLGSSIPSDNMETEELDDSSYLTVNPANVTEYTEDVVMCEGETLDLTSFYNNQLFNWHSGATDTVITVGQGGVYKASYQQGCDSFILTYTVSTSSVNVMLSPASKLIRPSMPFDVTADVTSTNSTSLTYQWSINNGTLSCYNCQGPVTVLTSMDDEIWLVVTNEHGCRDSARVIVTIDTTEVGDFYIPTAFSPNRDGHNDVFYIYGDGYWIKWFEIYDMWGGLQYRIESTPTGYPDIGWNGESIHSNNMYSNVYLYIGVLLDPYGRKIPISGTITIMR